MRELFPILLTLALLTVGFGLWYAGRNEGWYIDKSAADINICRKDSAKLQIEWKYPGYGINGWSASRHNDDILHISFHVSRNSHRKQSLIEIDTKSVRHIEIYGKMYALEEIPVCK